MKCPNCGFKIVKIKKEKERSTPQNRYFHGVILPILADHTGYTNDEMKAVLKWQFHVKHTSSLTTAEFEQLCSDIRRWASRDLSCWVPEPNEENYDG